MKNAIVEYLDYQVSVTHLKEPKGNGDIQAAKRGWNAPPTGSRRFDSEEIRRTFDIAEKVIARSKFFFKKQNQNKIQKKTKNRPRRASARSSCNASTAGLKLPHTVQRDIFLWTEIYCYN